LNLPQSELDRITGKVITNIHKCYDREQAQLASLAETAQTEGVIRDAAGNLVESLLQNIFDTINTEIPGANIESIVGGRDRLSKTIHYKGRDVEFNQIQVDRHIFSNKKRIAFIENKTYLDSCYYDRALADFRKIAQSLKQHGTDPADVKYIVFAGQNAAKDKTLFVYEADFWDDTKHLTSDPNGIESKIFFFLKNKRSSAKPLYKVKHELDDDVIKKFVSFIIEIL